MPSADLDAAVPHGRQGPHDQQRPVVHRRQALHRPRDDRRPFREAASSRRWRRCKIGDPIDPTVEIGPLATPAIRDEVDGLGRRRPWPPAPALALGGQRPDGPGNFYPPTVLADVPDGSPADREEIFGPVASLFRVAKPRRGHRASPTARASASGASAWTNDPAERDRLVRELEAGSVFINGMVKTDPRLPFGGVKKSGLRPRALRARHPRVRQHQDGLGGVAGPKVGLSYDGRKLAPTVCAIRAMTCLTCV